MDKANSAPILKAVDLFSGLDDDTLSSLAERVEVLDLPQGARLFERGDPGDAMFVVVQGRLQVHDDRTVFSVLEEHDAFGEYALLETIVRTASVTAVLPTRLLTIRKDDFLDLMRTRHEVASGVIRGLIARVTSEKDRSEKLLQSIFPREVAEEYKRKGRVDVRKYERVTVMFTDFAGFTRVSERHPPEKVIEELDRCFSAFDEITDRHEIQKIKTTGDGYMCAGGVPSPNTTNPVDVVLAGLEIQEFMRSLIAQRKSEGMDYWQCRMGINTGDCFAAVIGKSKLTYDIWSDTVNAASRLETIGEVGLVNVGKSTFQLIRDLFDCESRGRVSGKGREDLDAYVVLGIRSNLSLDEHRIRPSEAFRSLCSKRFE